MATVNTENKEVTRHAITLQQLSTLIAAELSELSSTAADADRVNALRAIASHVSAACLDDGFVGKHLNERASGEAVREVLYEDAELGFCICGHVYADAAHGGAHDHGPSWAIYGQAEGETEMSDWQVEEVAMEPGKDGRENIPVKLVKKNRTYTLQRGDAHIYDVGDIHSPSRAQPVKLLRVEGENLDNIKRSKIRPISDDKA